MENIIEIKDLTYYSNKEIIFDKLNLKIKPKTYNVIYGNNGTGKTILSEILLGIRNTNYYISINGLILTKENHKNIREKTKLVSNKYDFTMETPFNEFLFVLENLNLSKTKIKETIDEVLNIFDIKEILDKNIKDLTAIQKKLILIISALITKPDIIIFDNIKIKKHIKKIKQNYPNITIILFTNNIEDILLFDNVFILDKSITTLKKEDIINNYELIEKPFIIELSEKLKLYDLIEKNYLSVESLVNDLWK